MLRRSCFSLPVMIAAGVFTSAGRGEPLPADAIAIAVVFDTSGSMRSLIRTGVGDTMDTKYRVAQRAFTTVIDRLEAFASEPANKPLQVGVYVFHQDRAHPLVPLEKFEPAGLRRCLDTVEPGGSTPLGDTLYLAATDLFKAAAAARHLLVLTDGANTTGRRPEAVLGQVSTASTRREAPLFTHVIALDISPSVFAALERQGATLIGAADGAQLSAQFDFILEEKILVEAPR